jgi:hypothetical protein
MTKRPGIKVTAAELLAKLSADPKHLAEQEARDRQLVDRARRLQMEERPVIDELREVGVNVNSVWDLVNTAASYERGIPILLKHLKQPYSDTTKEGIARALAVREARRAWPVLVSEYINAPRGTRTKDGLAVAIAAVATDDVMEELIQIIKDRFHGASRVLLLKPLRKSRSLAAKEALEYFATDPDLATEIHSWRGSKSSRSH